MILLNGHSLTPVRRLKLESQSLTLKERDSNSALHTTDTSGITMTSWMQDDTDPGAGIVWRVRGIQEEFGTGTTTVQLEHIINTLKDKILFGEIKADTITGVEGATTCTARQAVNYILAQQSDWELDDFDYGSVTNAYKFDGDTLFDALERVSETLEDPWWSFDTTVYPFQLSITHKQSGTACEMRPGRNLVSLNRTIDRSGMYTRFYPIGKEDLHVPGNYIQKNTSLYGVISHVETDTTRETVEELTAWANERLNRHAEPRTTSTADGLELADATGEPLDRLRLGRICRMPLPEYGTTIEARINELNYRDKIHQPKVVRVTMGNQQDDIMKLIADEMKNGAGPMGNGSGGGGGRGGARQQKEDHAWFEDTDEHVAMVAEGIIGTDASGNPNWTRLAQIIVDGTGIHAGVKDFIGELEHFQTDFEMNESKISLVVGRYNGQNYIKAGEICLAINEDESSEARILADHVYIGNVQTGQPVDVVIAGKLTADDITTTFLQSKISAMGIVSVASLASTGGITCGGGSYGITTQGVGTVATLQVTRINLNGNPSFNNCLISASKNSAGDTLTLTYANGDTLTFNKAASATKVSRSWSGNQVTVIPDPNGSASVSFRVTASCTYDSANNRYVAHAHADGSERDTDYLAATAAYNKGYNDALTDAGISGSSGTVYTGTWYGTLYVAPTGGAQEVPNCVGQVTYHQLQKKT